MAARKKKKGATGAPTPVTAYEHGDKRAHLPTAENADLVTPEVEAVATLRYPRNADLDPQLVWKGKDEQDGTDLEVDVPPIYVQEKIDPRVVVENLRTTAAEGDNEPELTLFDSFDGVEGLASVEFYRHEANWSNRMILGDSLQTMASLAEREAVRGKVQMIYMDPPYGIQFGSNWQVSIRNRTVKNNKADMAREVEVIKAFRDTWELGIHSYLTYLRDRLTVARDLLTETGSIFMQIGDENMHIVRAVMDEVFGSKNFVSLIAFRKTSPLGSSGLGAVADYLIWYARDKERYKFRNLYQKKSFGGDSLYTWIEESGGTRRRMSKTEKVNPSVLPKGARPYREGPLISAGFTESCFFDFEFEGRLIRRQRYSWKTNPEGMKRLMIAQRVVARSDVPAYVRYFDDFPMMEYTNMWSDTGGATDLKYVVQTSTKVVERCMLMCTDPGDLVLDPTCGSGTTAVVAEEFGRRWITIDSSRIAIAIAKQRMMSTKFPYYLLADSEEGRAKEQLLGGTVSDGRPCTGDIRKGFVYQRVPHVTLGSIAQNPDIKPGMSKADIDAVIARSAETELLFDRPYEDAGTVRVAGRFSVESLSPHRAIAPDRVDVTDGPAGVDAAEEFNTMILENLARAGIQNGIKNERLTFDQLDPHAAVYVQALGHREGDERPSVALSIGPQYGTVSSQFVRAAVREAQAVDGVNLLCVLGFAFDPNVLTVGEVDPSAPAAVTKEVRIGRVTVVFVRMNVDLLMGRDLKKTGAGNLFMVAGEPDVEISVDGDDVVVKILGVDVFDPNTDSVRTRSADEVALWMIDTNYNGESFFVRHCYFPGGYDWYKQLKRALKAEIDQTAWESLNKTVSRPFAKPETGKIAVKVINDYGDEVVKVFEIR